VTRRSDLDNGISARQGADIQTHTSHRVFLSQRLILTGVGFVSDRATQAFKASLSKTE
jgi:hypothetical protein